MSEKVNYGVLKDYDGNKFIPVGHSKLVYDENGNTVEDRLTTLEDEMDNVQAQDSFKNIKVGSTTIAADQAEDTLELAAGSGITLTPDATNDKVTISHSNQVTAKTSYSQNSNANASGNSFTVTEVKYDTEGHITGKQEKTITLPSDISGNAATATRLETPVNITITDSNGNNGNTTSLIGNTDITLDLPDTITANIEGKDGEYFFIDKENKVVAKISESGIEATNVTSSKTSLNDLKDAFDDFANDVITEVVAGAGLTGGGSNGSVTLNVGAGNGITVSDNVVSHSDTSTLSGAQAAGTGKAITSVTVDTFGHVTATGSSNVVTGITAGDGLTGSATSGAVELDVNVDRGLSIVNDKVGHSYTAGTDTTSTANPGYGKTFTVVDSVTKDTYGHVTKVNTKTVTMPGEQTVNNATITIAAGKGLTTGGDFTTNQSSNETITLNVGAGAGISVQDDTVTNAGVRSVAEGTKRGTIAVNTNGTTADVAVNGLGFEDDGSYHFIDNNEKVITKIDGAGVHATDFIIDGADTSLSGVKAQYTTLKSQLDNTKYAASTSVGGPAVSANKLNTNAGSSTNPVYFENGIPKATGNSLAKDITGNAASANKVNNKLTIAGKTYDGSAAVAVSIADLGVTGAMVYLGTSTTTITDGGTEKPTIGGTAIVTTNLQKGNVVLYGSQEFVWTGSKWELLGDEGSYALKTVSITAGNGLTGGGTLAADRTISHADTSTLTGAQSAGTGKALTSVTVDGFGHVTATGSNSFKTPQTAVTSPSTSGNASAFIDTISQNTNGEIIVTKKNVQISIDATATDDDIVVLTATDGTNAVTYDAKHAKKGPSSGYTSGNTETSISGSGDSGTIKIPQLTVDAYGHVTAAADESITITMPSSVTGNAGTADKWKTARNISIADSSKTNTGTAVSVDGSENETLLLPATIKATLTGNADTTTKLKTARKINGTDFDGSTDITTTKWGTARNISITDNAGHTGTATAVDGSATVSLDLPDTIAADLVGNIATTDDHYAFVDSKNNTLAIIQNGGIKTVDVFDKNNNALSTAVQTVTASGTAPLTLTAARTGNDVAISGSMPAATASQNGYMTSTQVAKLNGIAAGAEVNQNAFSNVKVGSTTIAADAKTDTLELVASTNVTITPDATNDKVTISALDEKVKNEKATTTKAYVTGTTSSSTNTGTQVFDTGVYLTETASQLHVGSLEAATSLLPDTIAGADIGTADLPWDDVNANSIIIRDDESTNTNSYATLTVATEGINGTAGVGRLTLGNKISKDAETAAGNAKGQILMYGENSGYTVINQNNNTASNITITLPDNTGTLATIGNIGAGTGMNKVTDGDAITLNVNAGTGLTANADNITLNTATGSALGGVKLSDSVAIFNPENAPDVSDGIAATPKAVATAYAAAESAIETIANNRIHTILPGTANGSIKYAKYTGDNKTEEWTDNVFVQGIGDSGDGNFYFVDNQDKSNTYNTNDGMHSVDFTVDGVCTVKGLKTSLDSLRTDYNTLNDAVVKAVTASGTAPLTLGAVKSGNNVSITGSIASATASNKGIVKVDDSTYLLNPNGAPKAASGTAASPYAVAMAISAASGMVDGLRDEVADGYITKASVIDGSSSVSWGQTTTLATVDGKAIDITMPSNPNTNTTYSFSTGDGDGQIKITPSSGSAYNVTIKGLGDTADSSSGYLKLSGGIMSGHIYLGGSVADSSTSNTSQLIFGTPETEHVVISSNDNAIIINPSSSTTENQIELQLDKASNFKRGLSIGIDNTIGTTDGVTNTDYSYPPGVAIGRDNTLNGTSSLVIGASNSIPFEYTELDGINDPCTGNIIIGINNECSGCDSFITGVVNTIHGGHCGIIGYGNRAEGNQAICFGSKLIATNNIISNAFKAQVVVGYGNISDPDAVFIVGNGIGTTEEYRNNAFTVKKDGSAILPGTFSVGNLNSVQLSSQYLVPAGAEESLQNKFYIIPNSSYSDKKVQLLLGNPAEDPQPVPTHLAFENVSITGNDDETSYTYSIPVSGVTSSSTVIVSPTPIEANMLAYATYGLYCSGQSDGILTFTSSTHLTSDNSILVNIAVFNQEV